MATAYSDDLRRKLLEAHQQGEGSLKQLAARFRVSVGWALKVSAEFSRTGQMERPRGRRRGPPSRFTEPVRAQLWVWIREQPDLTLMEIQGRMRCELGLAASVGRLWSLLRELGLRLKKSRFTPPSKTRSQSARGADSGAKRRAASTRRG